MSKERRSETADAVALLTRADGLPRTSGPKPIQCAGYSGTSPCSFIAEQASYTVHFGQTVSVVARTQALRGASTGFGTSQRVPAISAS